MSENITHTAVVDDCARLAIYAPQVTGAFKQSLRGYLEFARLGGLTRSGDLFTPRLLGKFREEWAANTGDLLPKKLAFVLGWLSHRAADRQMKRVFRAADGDCPHSPTDCSIYHDVFLYREVYASGRTAPYSPSTLEPDMTSHPAAGALDIAALEDVLHAIWQRGLLAMHTFIPDYDDPEGWLERVFKHRQQFSVDVRRYAEAFTRPDPEKMRRFIHDINFYDAGDPLIRLARSLQQGAADETVALEAAVDAAAAQSQYAQALRKGFLYIQAASEYFERQIDEDVLRARLDIGKPDV